MKLGLGLGFTRAYVTETVPSAPSYTALDQVVAGGAADLDATISESYAGSGYTFSNLTAQGSSYNFTNNGSLVFNGSPGDPSAYWSTAGAGLFTISGGNTALLDNMHKTTGATAVTHVFAFRTPATISNGQIAGTATANTQNGIQIAVIGGSIRVSQKKGATPDADINLSGTALSVNTDYLLAIAFDFTGGSIKHALNATSFTADSFTSEITTTNASNSMQILGVNDVPANAGYRLYAYSLWPSLLSDIDLQAVRNEYIARHNRSYS